MLFPVKTCRAFIPTQHPQIEGRRRSRADRGEFDDFAGGVFEADLAVLGGFGPSTLNDGAVLEDVGLTGADGGDRFMVAVSMVCSLIIMATTTLGASCFSSPHSVCVLG